MSERLLGSRDDATAVRGTELVRCTVRWWIDDAAAMPYGVEATGPWGSASARGRDLSGALRDARLRLEGSGWLLAVNGARAEVRQSGMLAGSGSDRAYVLKPGEPADPEKTVGLFDDAPVESVLSVEQQEAAYRRLMDEWDRRAAERRAQAHAQPEAQSQAQVQRQSQVPPQPPRLQGAERPVPELTAELRAQARRAPDTWLYSIDPMYDPAGEVPPFAVIGAWQVDARGEPGAFQHNPNYRPSPVTLGWPRPTDPVDASLQLAASGHGPDEAVPGALAAATVYLPDEGEDIAVYTDAEGRFVPVLTHPDHAPAHVPRLRPVNGAELARLLPPDLTLKLNPGGRVSVRVPVSDVRAAAERLGH
ncbi:type VII secretion system-associated protein [Streptomyces sp. NPDC006551]|uniref:type VII secretion system-associated protein n=1 Tax=Streptomyces sp. NPDC006551 TaxID=3157178 RepID=UPI0033A7CBD8